MPDTEQTHCQCQLQALAEQLGAAQTALRTAAGLCPGNVALQAGLLERADWCRAQFLNTTDRLKLGLTRRVEDRRG